jgi:alkanesulfonate monooxygenase SsuD/methylene tetrahydromethanopterin reductase-like flavin-dependent oxidoreductase (luciferase family)
MVGQGRTGLEGVSAMKLGIFNLMTLVDNPRGVDGVLADTQSMVLAAEQAGFDIAFFAEHHFTSYSLSVSPLMTAAAMAGRTSRIGLGVGVIVLPLYHPLRVAQEIAFVDRLSGGRLHLGLGTGYQPYEFDRLGIPIGDKVAIFRSSWDIVQAALTRGEVDTGQPVAFTVRPTRMPPLYLTTLNPEIVGALAAHRPTLFLTSSWKGLDALQQGLRDAEAGWAAAGGTGAPSVALQQYIHVTGSKTEARDAAERARYVVRVAAALRGSDLPAVEHGVLQPGAFTGEPPLETFQDNFVIGDPDYVAERMVREIRTLGLSLYNTIFQFGDMPIGRAHRSLDRFSTEVLPILRRELPEHFGAAQAA